MLYIVCSWMTTWLGNRKVTMPMLSQYGAMLILVNGVKQKISNKKNKRQGKLWLHFGGHPNARHDIIYLSLSKGL